MRRPAFIALFATLAGLFAILAPSASAAGYTTSGYASKVLSLVNQARAGHGLPALKWASGTSTVAANWTAHMASTRTLAHNPNLQSQIESHGSYNWTTYGENVGQGYADDPNGLFQAYMNSPEHRANILDGDYRYVGVAVTFAGKLAWNTFDFVDAYGAPTVAKTQPKPKPSTAPVQHHASRPAPAPVHHAAAPAPKPAAHKAPATHKAPARPANKPRKSHPVQVKGLQAYSPSPAPLRRIVLAGDIVAAPAAPALPLTDNRSRALAAAIAVLMLAYAGRRWVRAVARV